MGSVARLTGNPLAKGFYTVPDAARLIEVGNTRRIYGWVRGYPNSAVGPLLQRDYLPLTEGDEELSFLDLMEIRAVEFFRSKGVKARTLRRAINEARDHLKTEHPFASEIVTFKADKKFVYIDDVLKQSAEEEHDRMLYNLLTRQYESYTLLKGAIGEGVEYDPKSHMPLQWTPRLAFPRITINPRISYGRPALPNGIATTTLYEAWKAEDKNYDEVGFWFDVPANDVRQAVEFEQTLAKAA